MKKLFLLVSLMIALNANALDERVFSQIYPGISDFQGVCLQGMNTYFYALLSKSVLFKNVNGQYVLNVQDDDGETIQIINVRIDRISQNNELLEKVVYVLPNSNSFSYTVKKNGNDLTPTDDRDLLTFNLKNIKSNYEINIVPFQTIFIKNGIKDFMQFGFMEVNVMIQTVYFELEAQRNYIYFFKEMPNPQSSLSVRVIEESEAAQTFNYIHSSQGAEISPKYFFKGLQDGAQIFKGFSAASLQMVKGFGFPAIKGINE